MNDKQYFDEMGALVYEARKRGKELLHDLVAQPPLRIGGRQVREYADWLLEQGALHAEVVLERKRRRELARAHPQRSSDA